MLKEKIITKDFEDLDKFKQLYRTAFPKAERVSLKYLLEKNESGRLAACYDGDVFCGFYAALTLGNITYISFLAVEDELRDRGYGSQMLEVIRSHYSTQRIILDIEAEDPSAANNDQRIRRKAFYKRNGYTESGIKCVWRGVAYEILIRNGSMTEEEFDAFWDSIDDDE